MARPVPDNDNNPDGMLFAVEANGMLRVICDDATKRYPPPREVPQHVVRRVAMALGVSPDPLTELSPWHRLARRVAIALGLLAD
jgi:hypothetical protein